MNSETTLPPVDILANRMKQHGRVAFLILSEGHVCRGTVQGRLPAEKAAHLFSISGMEGSHLHGITPTQHNEKQRNVANDIDQSKRHDSA